MLVPTHMKRDSHTLPPLAEDHTRYVVADNGIFLERHTPMFTTAARVSHFDLGLADHRQYCRLNCGKLPHVMQRSMIGFFRYAHEVHGGEAALVLLYDPRRRIFRWHCPEQTVELFRTSSGWSASDCIEFRHPLELPDGYVHFGDAHLHPGSPHPSFVDLQDDLDGLHIIVGDITRRPSYHIDFVMDAVRFHVPPEIFLESRDCQPFERPPEAWLRQIHIRCVDRNEGRPDSVETPTDHGEELQ